MKEGEAMESPNEREQGEREKTDREKTGTLLSLGVNKRDLSSQSFAVYTEAMGDPCCVCVCNSLTTLRAPSLSPSHTPAPTHTQLCLLVCTVCGCICICMWLGWDICPLRRTGVSMERGVNWWACLGQRPSFDTEAEGNLCRRRNVDNQEFLVMVKIWTADHCFRVWKCKSIFPHIKRAVFSRQENKKCCHFLSGDKVLCRKLSAYFNSAANKLPESIIQLKSSANTAA